MLGLSAKRVRKVGRAVSNSLYRQALRHGVLAASEHEAVLSQLPPMALVLDVGANVGQFALVARRAFPEATILSFEPLDESAAKLRDVFRGDARHEILPVAISDAPGRLAFHVTGANDSSSLLRVGSRQVEEFPSTKEVGERLVDVMSLDGALDGRDLPAGPGLLKIDTQGTELAVLQGASATLERLTHLLVEVSFVELYEAQADAGELVTALVEGGWRLRSVHDVKHSRLTGEPIQADMLFELRRPT